MNTTKSNAAVPQPAPSGKTGQAPHAAPAEKTGPASQAVPDDRSGQLRRTAARPAPAGSQAAQATSAGSHTPQTPPAGSHAAHAAPAGKTESGPSLYPNEPGFRPAHPVRVGGVVLADTPIEYNTGRRTVQLTVRNTGDRPIQVGSHFHLFEANRYLEFDRDAAFGCHLNIPATTAIRFEPGDEKQVEAVPFSGKRRIIGFNGLVMGYSGDEDAPTYFPARLRALRAVRHAGFRISDAAPAATTPTKSDDTKK